MARKRHDNKKWKSRPSRKKIQANRNRKPCKIRKNNSKPSRPTKPSQQRRKIENHKSRSCTVSPTFEVESNIEAFDARIVHNFLSERYLSEIRQSWYSCKCCTCEQPLCNMRTAKKEHENYHDCFVGDTICSFCYDFIAKDDVPFCPHSRCRNMMEIPITPICLKLGFLEQRAIALMHCYMSILIVRGHQSAMKGQVVHCQVDVADNIGDLLPLPKCYEFMAVIQQKPTNDNDEIKSTVRYSVSAIQILHAIQYLIQHHIGYMNKQVLPVEKIEEMFQCRKEDVAPIRIIDSYAYNNSTTSAPIILDVDEAVFGPSRTLKPGDDPIWKIQSGMEECTFPWIYPTGEGGELDAKRPVPLKLRDYCKFRLMCVDKRWQADPIWTFRAMNLIQRDDLCTAVNYHAKRQFKKDRLCYSIYPSIGKAVRGTAAFWSVPRKILRSMYATLSKPNIFLSINLQDDVEFLTHIDPTRFGTVNDPNYHAIDTLPDDDYLQLVNENSALVARMCHRRMLAFEKFISDKKHPFFIVYIVSNYFFKIEFQRDGLPHLHTLLWLDNFPSIDTLEGRKSVIEFIDKFLSTCLPDKQEDPEGYLLSKQNEELMLFKIWGNNRTSPNIVTNLNQFIENLTCRYEYDIWGPYINWDTFIIAGGSVISSLLAEPLTKNTSDIDLFFLQQNSRLFKTAVNELENQLQSKYFVRRKTIWSNRLIQFDLYRKITINDIFNGNNFSPSIIIQLICPTLYPITVSRILHSFDLDICACAFDSKRVLISFSCLQALNSGHTTCYAMPVTNSQYMRRVPRLLKYQQRGFNILCPKEFDINAFLTTSIENCNESQFERTYRFRRRHFGDNHDSFCLQKKFCEHHSLI
ncbi:unnamed protein product [Rotaria sp. Silwood1]|nr:unnamed protein product [Rotaria sp. Silwood1]